MNSYLPPEFICREFGLVIELDRTLERAEAHFYVAASGNEAALHTALGLRLILAGAAAGALRASHQFPAGLIEGFALAMSVLRRTARPALEARLMQAAIALTELDAAVEGEQSVDAGIFGDALDQIAWLANDLDNEHRRSRINARGAPLARRDALDRATLAEPAGPLN